MLRFRSLSPSLSLALSLVGVVGLTVIAACSSTDEDSGSAAGASTHNTSNGSNGTSGSTGAGSSSGSSGTSGSSSGSVDDPPAAGEALPAAVGWLISEIDGNPWPICPATLISSTSIATHASCIGTSFSGPGGENGSGTLYFALASDAYTQSKWISITKASSYQNAALGQLATPVAGVTPIPLAAGPLGAGDVDKSFLTARVAGRSVQGSVPGGTKLTLNSGVTVLKSVSGQGMHAVFPTYNAFVNAFDDSVDAADDIAAGPDGQYSNARVWQRPLLGAYEVVTNGDNESAIAGGGIDTKGAPLLRKSGGSYELVGIYKEAVSASDKTKTPYVLASYYVGFPSDTLSFLGGLSMSDNACGDVKPDVGQCRNGFALNCGTFGSNIIDLASDDSAWCGPASKCKVTPYANGSGSSASCTD